MLSKLFSKYPSLLILAIPFFAIIFIAVVAILTGIIHPPFFTWLDSQGVTWSHRTGVIEALGWLVTVWFVAIGLWLAHKRTVVLEASLIETQNSHLLTRESIDATKRQIEIAAATAEHDTETEMRKQFREACSLLDIEDRSLTKYAQEEIKRLALARPEWFATPAIGVLENFWNTPNCRDQTLIFDCISIACTLINNTENWVKCPEMPQYVIVSDKTFAGNLFSLDLRRVIFRRCVFNGTSYNCKFDDCRFRQCEFSSKGPVFVGSSFVRAKLDFGHPGGEPMRPVFEFEICNLTDTNVSLTQYEKDETIPEFYIRESNVTALKSFGLTPNIRQCWYINTSPKIEAKDIKSLDCFEASTLKPSKTHVVIGDMYLLT